MRLLERDGDVVGLGDIVTHRLPLDDALTAYANFQAEQDQTFKVFLRP
jgi:threonine dehydrogenase-like Zn-dependent dehydrogenase